MINQHLASTIYCGTVIHHSQIAKNIYHIKLQSTNLAKFRYVAGLTLEVYLSNPYANAESLFQKFSVWNFEPVFNTIDIVINTRHKSETAIWIKSVQIGDKVFFKEPIVELVLDDTAAEYLFIGNIASLPYFYELNRSIAISKKIHSIIFTTNISQIFPDIDHSFPLSTYFLDAQNPEDILKLLKLHLPKLANKIVAYVLAEPNEIALINNFLKTNSKDFIPKIYSKSF
ncbi:hypothetical protein [Empedobacter brevis]|uniref:hypothetical protein n=1 Tax=Empedobacter brevis TaxID=247 RepID=UPI0039B0E874